MEDAKHPVAVTGLGFVSPLGFDLDRVWSALHAGGADPAWHEHRLGGEVWGRFPVFAVRGFDPRRLPFDEAARSYAETHALWRDTDLMYLAAAALAALVDAGPRPPGDGRDVGLVLTHENPGVDRLVGELFESFQERPSLARRDAADFLFERHHEAVYDLQTFMPLHRVARLLDIHGPAYFVNNACASGLYALELAAMLVRSGQCRRAIVAGADHPTSFAKFRWFDAQGLVAPDGVMRPFDAERRGFVLGDGAAALVLEPVGATTPYARYLGGGFDQEAWKVALPDPASGHYEAAIRTALARSGIAAGDVDWLVAHGAATSVTDAYEARSLRAVFGDAFLRPRLAAFKPYVGHNLGGSGVTETALLLLAMRRGHLPPVRHCTRPDPALRLQPLARGVDETPRFAMKCAAGFGGFNAACVFENGGRA